MNLFKVVLFNNQVPHQHHAIRLLQEWMRNNEDGRAFIISDILAQSVLYKAQIAGYVIFCEIKDDMIIETNLVVNMHVLSVSLSMKFVKITRNLRFDGFKLFRSKYHGGARWGNLQQKPTRLPPRPRNLLNKHEWCFPFFF